MTNVPFMTSLDTVTVFIDGKPETLNTTHPNYQMIIDHLKAGTGTSDVLRDLVSIPAYLTAKINIDGVAITEDTVYFNGKEIHSFLSRRMMEIIEKGFDVTPWAKFMSKLYSNPSETAINELFEWLDKAQMPITPNGNFLAYKKVDTNYNSYHRGVDGLVVSNKIGETPSMDRDSVDPDRYRTCSAGLHFCSFSYLKHYHGGSGRVVILEIDPADVVAIPADYENAKGRAWKYTVIGEVPEKDAAQFFDNTPVYDNNSWYDEEDDDENWDSWYC